MNSDFMLFLRLQGLLHFCLIFPDLTVDVVGSGNSMSAMLMADVAVPVVSSVSKTSTNSIRLKNVGAAKWIKDLQ